MKNIGEMLNDIANERLPEENEYINESDGLIYCSKCNTPKQMKIEMLGKMLTVPVMCHCRSVEYEKEQEEYKKRERMEHIARLRSAGLHIHLRMIRVIIPKYARLMSMSSSGRR